MTRWTLPVLLLTLPACSSKDDGASDVGATDSETPASETDGEGDTDTDAGSDTGEDGPEP